jgi:tRNA wybutosine-synthesizing protein 2
MGLEEQLDSISITTYPTPTSQPPSSNVLLVALSTWLHVLPAALLPSLDLTPAALLSAFPSTYSLYKPLLLLPAHAFRSPAWTTLLSALPLQPPPSLLPSLYATLAHVTGATHVALNAPIPPQRASSAAEDNEEEGRSANVLRAPLALVPLHGDFGGRPTAAVAEEEVSSRAGPTAEDFAAAFWVSARQNGVVQVWAPLYTMFSRGNVSEKARVLGMASVRRAVGEGEGEGGGAVGCAAVDLYAGIGYFAFSYRKAGVRRVLCWELNPWSVEGLRRGAAENGWSVESFGAVGGLEGEGEKGVEADFWVFEESNEFALEKILRLRNSLPPIRHVNCGLLPTSRGSWKTAVEAVDPAMGGWIHLHENIAVKDIEAKAEDIVREIQAIVDDEPQGSVSQGSQKERQVRLEHVEKVKTYAPGVMHCVLDIYIPRKDACVRNI